MKILTARFVSFGLNKLNQIETIIVSKQAEIINNLKFMTKKKTENKKTEPEKAKKYDKELFQPGGTYFHCGSIIGHKNVFVTSEYADLLVNAFKMAEVQKDVKTLSFVIMPNFFYWMFRLSPKSKNPVEVYGEVKKQVAGGILDNLEKEVKEGSFKTLPLFSHNERVGRSKPEKIRWTFEEYAKKFKQNKRYRIWTPKTEIRLIDNDQLLQEKIKCIQAAPTSERWQMVSSVEKYPYYYLCDELEGEPAKISLSSLPAASELKSEKVTV